MKDFSKKYLIYSIITFVILVISVIYLIPEDVKTGVLLNFLFFFVITYPIALVVLYFTQKTPQQAPSIIMASTFLKIVISCIYFFFVFKQFSDYLYYFAGSFFIGYIIFTTFEVLFIVRKLNKKQ